MASGFGTFNSTTRITNASGAVVSATLSQWIDSNARTVTVTMRITAAYYRYASGSWTPGGGVTIYGSQNTGNYMRGSIGGIEGGISGVNIGVASKAGVTYNAGLIYNLQEGYVQQRSGYEIETTFSRTYSYNSNGDAISDWWNANLYLPGLSTTISSVSGSFTTDSIGSAAVAPSGLSVVYTGCTWNSISGTVSLSSYGIPSDNPNRYLEFGAMPSSATGYGSPYRYTWQAAATSANMTVTNSSAGSGGFDIKGMTAFKVGVWATNYTLWNSAIDNTVRYTPPAPGQLTYTVDPNDVSRQVITYVGVAANNDSTHASSMLTRTVRFADSADPNNWTYVTNDVVTPLTDQTNGTFVVPAQHTIIVEAWMTYRGNQSEVSRVYLTNSSDPAKLYCSMGDLTERVDHLYGSVNGETKKIKKLYASVNGVAKLIHEDI